MRVHCFTAYPPGLEPLTMARTLGIEPQYGMEAGGCPLPHSRASKCVMPGSTMSETATVATRPTKSRRTDLSSNFEGCWHRWPPHAALLARERAESW
jgi:hypothetical protein